MYIKGLQWQALIVWLNIRHSCTSSDHLMYIKWPFEVLLCWIPVNGQWLVLIVWLTIRHSCTSVDHLMYIKGPFEVLLCWIPVNSQWLVLIVWLSIIHSCTSNYHLMYLKGPLEVLLCWIPVNSQWLVSAPHNMCASGHNGLSKGQRFEIRTTEELPSCQEPPLIRSNQQQPCWVSINSTDFPLNVASDVSDTIAG